MTYREAMECASREYWRELLKRTEGRVSVAAKIAGVNRSAAYKQLRNLGIERRPHRVGQWDRPLPVSNIFTQSIASQIVEFP